MSVIKELNKDLTYQPWIQINSSKLKALLLFDIDGVIRDVTDSYRLAIQETVQHFLGWRPSLEIIDELKMEGCWNNDWDASMELIKRHSNNNYLPNFNLPSREKLIKVFNGFYFGGDPLGSNQSWKGFIKNEPLLVTTNFFNELTKKEILWGFVSGAETTSAKFILEKRLKLKDPPLIAMEDAPSKPDPSGLIYLARKITERNLGKGCPPIAYLGDTIADVQTIQEARKKIPFQSFISIAIAPPHLHRIDSKAKRLEYEKRLKMAGADAIIDSTPRAIKYIEEVVFK